MAVYTHVSAEEMAALLARYDVGTLVSAKGIAEGVENSNYLLETTHARFILTLYEKRVDAGDLPFFLALLDHLAERGLPVPPAVRDREGEQLQRVAGRTACLIAFLPGVSVSHPTSAQARAAGAALGTMHAALMDFAPVRPNALGVDAWQPLFRRCGEALNDIAPGLYEDIARALEPVLATWPKRRGDESPADRNLPVSTIHADLFPDNVLMLGDEVTGLIDFYFACTDIRAYDLAVMHSAWAFDADGTPNAPAVGRALVAGYEDAFGLTDRERAALPVLAKGACLRFALTRAWDWLNTPPGALVTRKDPLAYMRRLDFYAAHGETLFA